MKSLSKKFSLILIIPILLSAQTIVKFDDFFIDKTMRIDYYQTGDAKSDLVTIHKIYQQEIWAGSKKHLLDNYNNGRYYYKIYDSASGKLIFSKGFDSYFGEYKTSRPAIDGIQKTFQETALIPFPKNKIKFAIEKRDEQNKLQSLFERKIDPADVGIIKNKADKEVKIVNVHKSGEAANKVDIVFIAEGYTKEEEAKFKKDLQRLKETFFDQEPYKTLKNDFNLYGVFKASDETGCDEPTHGSFKNTVVGATFNSMASYRYLLTEEIHAIHDVIAGVPADAILVVVNHYRYGGGGIYNFYCTLTADGEWVDYLFLHELGHSFSGLADEYYTSSTSYENFYGEKLEPTEANITALLDPQNVKWKDMLSPGIEVPTPWEKEE